MRRICLSTIALAVMALTGAWPAAACNATLLGIEVDYARSRLEEAARESSLSGAQLQTKRAYDMLRDAEITSGACDCNRATNEFGQASDRARVALRAQSTDGFAGHLNKSIQHFNNAIDELRTCRPQRRQ